jgi:hypothetical protein
MIPSSSLWRIFVWIYPYWVWVSKGYESPYECLTPSAISSEYYVVESFGFWGLSKPSGLLENDARAPVETFNKT